MNLKVIANLNGLDVTDYLYPGQTLIIPKEGITVHITEKGDTLSGLLAKTNMSVDRLLKDNPDIYLLENQLIVERKD